MSPPRCPLPAPPTHRWKDISHARESFPCRPGAMAPRAQPPSSSAPTRFSLAKTHTNPNEAHEKITAHFFMKLLNDRRDYFLTRSLSRFFSSLMNSCTSLKSMYTEANRTYRSEERRVGKEDRSRW